MNKFPKIPIFVATTLMFGFLFSCSQSGQEPVNAPGKVAPAPTEHPDTAASSIDSESAGSPAVKPLPVLSDTIFTNSTDTSLSLKDGSVLINGHIIDNKVQPRFAFTAMKGQTITATIKPVKKGGNVRINQIQQPGGAMDGPFGDSLSYTLKKNGKLTFIIGENMMAGDPYTGNFLLHVRLEKQ